MDFAYGSDFRRAEGLDTSAELDSGRQLRLPSGQAEHTLQAKHTWEPFHLPC